MYNKLSNTRQQTHSFGVFILFQAIALLLLFGNTGYGQDRVPEITAMELQRDVFYFASDLLQGRYPGTPEDDQAAEYIRDQFQKAGLTLLSEDGFQRFNIVTTVEAGNRNSLRIADYEAVMKEDFIPLAFSKNDHISAGVVFAGYGFEIDEDSLQWNDYENIDVQNKWVLILRGDPEMEDQESLFISYSADRDKVLTARDHDAAGVLLVSGVEYDSKDKLEELHFDKTLSNAGIPVIHIKRHIADMILEETGENIGQIETLLNDTLMPFSFDLSGRIDASTEIILQEVQTQNVIGMVEGNDPGFLDEYIVVGAHYDHLGLGGPGSGSRVPDTLAVHNGADDNASGVAGVIELAYKISANKKKLKRSIIFIAFGAEEMGLLGSAYFVKNPPVDLASIEAMVNLDMIGRLDKEKRAVMVGGTGTSEESESILHKLNKEQLSLSFSPEGYGPSDHASFYGENIPVFFFSTGAHIDYHTPEDDAYKLNYYGEKDLLEYIDKLLMYLSGMEEPLTFKEAGPKKRSGKGYRFKVTLGIMPDFTSTEENGLGVGGVNKDGPAYSGGMEKGDLIIALDGKPVNNIYDYMNRLKKLKPGQTITVDVIRQGEKKVLIIQL